jgi:hypothetical protein
MAVKTGLLKLDGIPKLLMHLGRETSLASPAFGAVRGEGWQRLGQ